MGTVDAFLCPTISPWHGLSFSEYVMQTCGYAQMSTSAYDELEHGVLAHVLTIVTYNQFGIYSV